MPVAATCAVAAGAAAVEVTFAIAMTLQGVLVGVKWWAYATELLLLCHGCCGYEYLMSPGL